jgi:hypothetical protein
MQPDHTNYAEDHRQVVARVADTMASLTDTAWTGDDLRYLRRQALHMVSELVFPRRDHRGFCDLTGGSSGP